MRSCSVMGSSCEGGSRPPVLVVMSRGPTRRVRRLLASGAVSGQLLQAADHQADLLGHLYIGLEHLDVCRVHLAGLTTERDALRQRMRVGVPRRWWRPRGPNSVLRRRVASKRRSPGYPQNATSTEMVWPGPGSRSAIAHRRNRWRRPCCIGSSNPRGLRGVPSLSSCSGLALLMNAQGQPQDACVALARRGFEPHRLQ
jgi:hypothetical protein